METILITGGAGFIGSHTSVELANTGYRPVIIDNFSNSNPSVITNIEKIINTKIAFYEGDFKDSELVKSIIDKEKVDGIIHFAAYKAVGESVEQPLKYYQNNVEGLVHLLDVIEEANISNFVFSSSCTVYGEAHTLPITEDESVKPASSPYGSSKQMGENILRDVTLASKNLRSIALRYFNPIGAHESALIGELPLGTPANLVPYVTQTAAGVRESLTVHGNDYPTSDGTCIRDYIHVVDLAKAHIAALQHLEKQTTSYYDTCNIGTGVGTSVLELLQAFEKVAGKKQSYHFGPRRAGDVVAAFAAVDKAREVLGWKAEYDLHRALLDSWHWQQTLVA